MAGGRARSNKRSSNSTCSTTVTTIIIAAMCVMGLWLLSPGSITSPLSTTRAAIAASTTTTAAGESNEVVQKSPVFEDSEENLPAMNAVMGSQRLSFPSKVFDLVQCARCRIPLTTCIHRVPTQATERGTEWPEEWPHRLETPPYWLSKSQTGVYGKPAPEDFAADYEHWKQVVRKLEVWVMNVVNTDSTDTLPIIFERGLLGIRHDWCESFSTYPRTYDLLHADHLFSAKYS